MQSLYEEFDYHKQGGFGSEELDKMATKIGESISIREIDQMIEYADLDRDGLIN